MIKTTLKQNKFEQEVLEKLNEILKSVEDMRRYYRSTKEPHYMRSVFDKDF